MRKASFFAGLLILGFNLYWLQRFGFKWNIITFESWVMLIVGIILILPHHQKSITTEWLVYSEIKKQLEEISKSEPDTHKSTNTEIPSQNQVSGSEINDKPNTDAIGNPDGNGYEWINTENGKNWYRTQGSKDDWIEFSN
tara:strand:- start:117 stop:536 length:420 start_codon:yes stop_codon:yes gene_type:complete